MDVLNLDGKDPQNITIVNDAPSEASMDDETATENAEQAVNVKIAVGNAVSYVDVKPHFC